MVKTKSISGMKLIPSGYSVKETMGQTFLVKRKRSHRRKSTKKQREARAKAAKRIKIPILTAAALALPTMEAIRASGAPLNSQVGFMNFSANLTKKFTGYNPSTQKFSIKSATGLMPLAALYAIKKTGILRDVNRTLAKNRLPVRLS